MEFENQNHEQIVTHLLQSSFTQTFESVSDNSTEESTGAKSSTGGILIVILEDRLAETLEDQLLMDVPVEVT